MDDEAFTSRTLTHRKLSFDDIEETLREHSSLHNEAKLHRAQLDSKLDSLLTHAKQTNELLEAWNSARGFLVVVRGLSKISQSLLVIGALVGAVLYWLHTGVWRNP